MKDELLALPQDEDVWVVGAQILTVPVSAGGAERPFWVLLVQSRTQYYALGVHTAIEQPGPQELLTALVDTMFEPKVGAARRPTAVEMGPNLNWEPLVPMLAQLGISAHRAEHLADLNLMFQHLSVQMSGQMLPNLPYK